MGKLMTVDIPLLRKTVEWAEAEAAKAERDPTYHPEWQQDDWMQARDRAKWLTWIERTPFEQRRKLPIWETYKAAGCGTAYCIAGKITADSDQPNADPEIQARKMLGLTHYQASELFDGGNDIEDIRAVAEAIAVEAGEKL